jgi:sugar lactone lactonase YvrE
MFRAFGPPRPSVPIIFTLGVLMLIAAGCSGSSSTNTPPPAPPTSGAMFITDFTNNSISGFTQSANCNCAPSVLIQGGKTGMSGPAGIAIDSSGNFYVTNENVNTVTKYPGAANGNVSPSFAIGGLNNPIGIHVDSTGKVYVANSASGGVGASSIQVFAAGSASASQTITGVATGLSTPGFVTLDSSGNIWVTNQTGNSIEEFANSASGNVSPLATISGSNTGLSAPQGIAFDSSGRLYVAINNSLGAADAVLVFSPPLSGNIVPSNILCGLNTGVNNPTGVAVNSQGTLFVANSAFGGSAGYETTFAANNIGGGPSCTGPLPNGVVGGSSSSLVDPSGIALR